MFQMADLVLPFHAIFVQAAASFVADGLTTAVSSSVLKEFMSTSGTLVPYFAFRVCASQAKGRALNNRFHVNHLRRPIRKLHAPLVLALGEVA